MNRIFYNFIIIILICFSNSLNARQIEFNKYFIQATKNAKPAVVNIMTYEVSKKNGERNLQKAGFGSGTIISKKGYIVTNFHVLKKGSFYQVILYGGKECEIMPFPDGRFFIADEKTDIAILRIDENEIRNINPIAFNDTSELEEGEWVLAIGNPYGLRQSVTCGIVSSKGRNDIGFADIEDFIQTDAPINPGNSGGPLINLEGKLVGINTAIRTVSGGYQGISFAIPSKIVKQVCAELIKYGRVRRGWLGFLAREKKTVSVREKKLIEVISVIKNSPAEISGICKGDIIKKIDDKTMFTLGEVISSVSSKPIGSKLKLLISRDGKLYDFCLILREKSAYRKINKALNSIYSLYGIDLDKNSITGDVVISYLSPMGLAYQNGLKKGDIVLSLNGHAVTSLEDFIKLFYKDRYNILTVEIFREPDQYTIEFAPD